MSNSDLQTLITRSKILDGHEKFAYVERLQEQLEHCCEQNNKYANVLASELQEQGGHAIMQHPDFLKTDGLPSPFNPEQDVDYEVIVGDPVLYAADEADKEKLAHKLGLTSKYVLKEKPKYELGMAPGMAPAKPRPA